MTESVEPPNVFSYLDSRRFLGDYYAFKKATSSGFSYRAFSRRAGIKSPNYLKLVIDGERNLTPKMAHRFGTACGLAGDPLGYFLDLVAFTQAKSSDEKTARYQRLIRFREHREIHRIDIAYGEYHARWYIPAIRELAFRADFQADPAWIADRMLPSISVQEAKRALELLEELRLLQTGTDGKLHPTDTLVTTGPEVKGLHLRSYHRMMMDRAAAALDALPPRERDISSVTLCLGPEAMQRMKERIRAFRRELLQMSASEEEPQQVIQVNLQLFPLTQADG
ncbi:MAG: TIGR02147 family protein [Myxococcota bacterium]